MQTNRKIIFLPSLRLRSGQALLLLVLLLAGCSSFRRQAAPFLLPQESREPAAYTEKQRESSLDSRFQDVELQGKTAVESAIQLSQKYAKLSEDAVALRGHNQTLLAENKQLKEQVADLDAKLKQTQKELTEANDLLIEMRIELNNWKVDVLGFRDEIREVETAQLEALLKILKILGGEVSPELSQSEGENSGAVLSTQGKTNE